jgi:hypothetical protein
MGPGKTVYQRFRQWRDDGTFERVLAHLHPRLREDGLMDLDTWMIDSTAVRATRAASLWPSTIGVKKGSAGQLYIAYEPAGQLSHIHRPNPGLADFEVPDHRPRRHPGH